MDSMNDCKYENIQYPPQMSQKDHNTLPSPKQTHPLSKLEHPNYLPLEQKNYKSEVLEHTAYREDCKPRAYQEGSFHQNQNVESQSTAGNTRGEDMSKLLLNIQQMSEKNQSAVKSFFQDQKGDFLSEQQLMQKMHLCKQFPPQQDPFLHISCSQRQQQLQKELTHEKSLKELIIKQYKQRMKELKWLSKHKKSMEQELHKKDSYLDSLKNIVANWEQNYQNIKQQHLNFKTVLISYEQKVKNQVDSYLNSYLKQIQELNQLLENIRADCPNNSLLQSRISSFFHQESSIYSQHLTVSVTDSSIVEIFCDCFQNKDSENSLSQSKMCIKASSDIKPVKENNNNSNLYNMHRSDQIRLPHNQISPSFNRRTEVNQSSFYEAEVTCLDQPSRRINVEGSTVSSSFEDFYQDKQIQKKQSERTEQ